MLAELFRQYDELSAELRNKHRYLDTIDMDPDVLARCEVINDELDQLFDQIIKAGG